MVLKDQVALITGASSGIGRATALAMAHEGARVGVNYHKNRSGAEEAVAEIQKRGGEALAIHADVTSAAEVHAMVEAVTKRCGRVDILVNNLGIYEPKAFEEIPDEDWSRFFEINVMSGVRLARAYLTGMKERNWGRIVFISSVHARIPYVRSVAYNAGKNTSVRIVPPNVPPINVYASVPQKTRKTAKARHTTTPDLRLSLMDPPHWNTPSTVSEMPQPS